MFNRLPLLGHHVFLVVITIIGIGLMPGTAKATGYWETVRDNALVALGTLNGDYTIEQEVDMINANWDEYNRQKKEAGKSSVAQGAIGGIYPVTNYASADLGTTKVLTYFFIDPNTGQRTTPAFEVSAVRYEALLEPPTSDPCELTEALIRANLTLLGTSTDAAHDFALNFTLQGFEPIILGFPLDAGGNEIIGEGTAGFVSSVLLPDVIPTVSEWGLIILTLLLLTAGVVVIWRRRRVAA